MGGGRPLGVLLFISHPQLHVLNEDKNPEEIGLKFIITIDV